MHMLALLTVLWAFLTPMVTGYAHGRCSFHAQINQFCYKHPDNTWDTATHLKMPYIKDNDHKVITVPAGGQPVPVAALEGWRIKGLDKDLWTRWEPYGPPLGGKEAFTYGESQCMFNSADGKDKNKCGDCSWGKWTKGDLHCSEGKIPFDWRTSDMDCSFNC
ncbi:hypothetical protein BU26DRAFT_603931 [Trematosphaeria pertusa]|uniref:Uncharacterized protein n=1 Tax=Trematosphaeria pertusa TaxID=390896 RepID=A0A6A6IPL7_9PLEO|nr:uncharacterized protein BU26DRAFT_603931 [Trematosphaeria pertusa]KAF2251530.1 hypothetical protein BU26DRAFT_603931 [Trematosphaeria pertusa]